MEPTIHWVDHEEVIEDGTSDTVRSNILSDKQDPECNNHNVRNNLAQFRRTSRQAKIGVTQASSLQVEELPYHKKRSSVKRNRSASASVAICYRNPHRIYFSDK